MKRLMFVAALLVPALAFAQPHGKHGLNSAAPRSAAHAGHGQPAGGEPGAEKGKCAMGEKEREGGARCEKCDKCQGCEKCGHVKEPARGRGCCGHPMDGARNHACCGHHAAAPADGPAEADRIREEIDNALKTAVVNPTRENVSAYRALTRAAQERSLKFAAMMSELAAEEEAKIALAAPLAAQPARPVTTAGEIARHVSSQLEELIVILDGTVDGEAPARHLRKARELVDAAMRM